MSKVLDLAYFQCAPWKQSKSWRRHCTYYYDNWAHFSNNVLHVAYCWPLKI